MTAAESIEQRQQLRCTHVYNRIGNAARVPRNRSALITSFVAAIGDRGPFVLRCGMAQVSLVTYRYDWISLRSHVGYGGEAAFFFTTFHLFSWLGNCDLNQRCRPGVAKS